MKKENQTHSFYRDLQDTFKCFYEDSHYETETINDLKNLQQSRYVQGELIGEGGMKYVYSAQDLLVDRKVARCSLKDSKNLDVFLKECLTLAKLDHPNIVPIYDLEIDATNKPFIIMKVLDGDSLSTILENSSAPKYTQAMLLNTFLKVCDAVAYAHAKKIIHCDIKPDNIQLDKFGEVILCDWGLAVDLSEENDVSGKLITGTPGYMAPEQIDPKFGEISPQTDLYSLGALLYEIAYSKKPYSELDVNERMKMTLTGPMDFTSKLIPSSLQAVIEKATHPQISERYESVIELQEDISKYLEGYATSVEDVSFTKIVRLAIYRNKLKFASAVSVILLLVVIVTASLIEIHKSEQAALKAKNNAIQRKSKLEQVSKEAAPKFHYIGRAAWVTHRFEEAKVNIDLGLSLDPEHRGLMRLKGFLNLYDHDFTGAVEMMRKCGSMDDLFINETDRLARKETSLKEYILRLKKVGGDRYLPLILPKYYSGLSTEAAYEFSNLLLDKFHRNKRNLKATILFDSETKSILIKDFHLVNLYFLVGLPIDKLELNSCNITHSNVLEVSEFKRLSIRNSNIDFINSSFLKVTEALDLTGSNVTTARIFYDLPIKKLSIANTAIVSADNYYKMSGLKDLTINTHQLKEKNKKHFKGINLTILD
ncbi:MAG: serine/threonine protein kinase [Lentisphaeraceae bacterium]|nr:serine/threonine protein kinase [Lentisphaeraceae bacterium]